MALKPATLDEAGRAIVLRTIQEVCRHEDWTLYAVHVRATHLHIVVSAELPPEQVMGKFKAYASRCLNEHEGQRRRRWSRHGSTRRLWSPAEVDATVEYVLRRQGQPMAVHEKRDRWSHL